jgi:AraC family transcriptional regulator
MAKGSIFNYNSVADSLYDGTEDVKIDVVQGIIKDVDQLLDGEHVFGLSPPLPTKVPVACGGDQMDYYNWAPEKVNYLPPNMRLQAEFSEPVTPTYVRISDRLLRNAAGETVDVSKLSFRWLRNVDDPIAVDLMRALTHVATEGGSRSWPLLTDSIGTALAVRLMKMLGAEPLRGDVPYQEGLSSERLRRVKEYVEANISRPIRLTELASIAALSPYHFARAFRKAANVTPVRYVWQRRVERAKKLLRDSRVSLAIIAYDCGFSSQSHFTTVFKRETGATPASYRVKILASLIFIGTAIFDALDWIDFIDFF